MTNCRRIYRRIAHHAHHAAHPIRHARHFVRAHYVAQVVCHATVAGGIALGVGFGAAARRIAEDTDRLRRMAVRYVGLERLERDASQAIREMHNA